jgi:hypothetical protein
MELHGMDSIQVQILHAEVYAKSTVTEFVFPFKTSYLGFRSNNTHIKTIVTDLINENKSSTIATLLYCMGFFLHRILGTCLP